LYKKIINGEFVIPEHFSIAAGDFVKRMLVVKPENRSSISEVIY
jgi:hypothetical protein